MICEANDGSRSRFLVGFCFEWRGACIANEGHGLAVLSVADPAWQATYRPHAVAFYVQTINTWCERLADDVDRYITMQQRRQSTHTLVHCASGIVVRSHRRRRRHLYGPAYIHNAITILPGLPTNWRQPPVAWHLIASCYQSVHIILKQESRRRRQQ